MDSDKLMTGSGLWVCDAFDHCTHSNYQKVTDKDRQVRQLAFTPMHNLQKQYDLIKESWAKYLERNYA